MESLRPYDTDQLLKLTDYMVETGSATVAPLTEGDRPQHEEQVRQWRAGQQPDAKTIRLSDKTGELVPHLRAVPAEDEGAHFTDETTEEPSTEIITEDKPALSGLRKVFSFSFSARRTAKKNANAERNRQVANRIADRVSNPRISGDIKENIGWVGTSKLEVEDPILTPLAEKKIETDFNKLGGTLFPKAETKTMPNHLRPQTKAEIRIDKRLERHNQKAKRFRNEAKWLRKGGVDEHAGLLSRAEKKHLNKINRRLRKLDRKTAAEERKFETARTTHGRLPRRWENLKGDLGRNFDRVPGAQASARALGKEIIASHKESWDLTREQAERLAANAIYAGDLVMSRVATVGEWVRDEAGNAAAYTRDEVIPEVAANARFAAKGGRYTAGFYGGVAKGAADIYVRAAKRSAKAARQTAVKAKSKIKRQNPRG